MPLLERERETELLLGAWRAAAGGRGSAWLVCAEAGGGKTRLAAEVARVAGSRVLWGAAEPVAPPDPYLAVRRAVPEFVPAPVRADSVERAAALLAAAGGPLFLVLDDLHFADEGTVAVLVRLAQESAARPWLIVAAFRPDEGPAALRLGATELVAQGAARRLDLAPLSREAVAELAVDVRRRAVAADEIESIWADSGGNPWFVEALARGNGAITAVRDRVSLRLERLEQANPGANQALRALAPATRPLPHDVVADLYGEDSPALRTLLARLRDAGLLRETDDGWQFRHELLRRALLDGMLTVERRETHRALAEALGGQRPATGATPAPHPPPPASRLPTPAEIAMHFAEARDPRAIDWAIRAAQEARAIDAHTEAMAQVERALSFEMEPERHRTTLRLAAIVAYDLRRPDDETRFTDAALSIPGGEPEIRAQLHQLAARAARNRGDLAADRAHLETAERLLANRPPSREAASLAVSRVSRAALDVEPVRIAAAAQRALKLAQAIDDPLTAAAVEVQTKSFLSVSLLDQGDPAGFAMLDDCLRLTTAHGLPGPIAVTALANAYEEAVLSLFHERAADIYDRVTDAMREHHLSWFTLTESYRALELTQRGKYLEASTVEGALPPLTPGSLPHAALTGGRVLREIRAGSPERARALLAVEPGEGFQQRALIDLARLELALQERDAGLGELAQRVYGTMNRRRYARVAGVAAVGLARAGRGAVPPPRWLVADAPLRVLWDWAAGIDRDDAALLHDVAARLAAMELPYEAALALRDAGDLAGAYRGLRAIDAAQMREQVAEQLRAADQPIPRRTRAATARAGLTDTERAVCRLVATGAGNHAIAATLGISPRTVATHLTRIYQKTACQGRTALAVWWAEQQDP